MTTSLSPRGLAHQAKSRLLRFDKGAPPIAIFGLRRGGTTMVAETVAANQGVWFANEPFAVLPAHSSYEFKRAHLPEREHSQFFDLDPEEEARFKAYSEGLLSAKHRSLGSCRRPKFFLTADRVCLKILNAPWMINWFEENTDAHILPLLRHPGAQAISVLRRNWGFGVEAYARRMDRIGGQFTPDQKHLIEEIIRSGERWRIAILDYAVCSKIIFQSHRDQVVRYEDVVAEPERFVDEVLIGRYGLSERQRMLETMAKPSGSSMMSLAALNQAIVAGDTKTVLNNWRKDVTSDMEVTGQRILDVFGIEIYSFTSHDI